ncbi:MAG: hypothetical protein EBS01_02955 [Verrucomicrobia bacterium]|nr:hypothetical protein [Verrucomicrobiota bacterium]
MIVPRALLFVLPCFCAFSDLRAEPAARKGILYKPTPDGGRACYMDGVFAYNMPPVPLGMYGSTIGVKDTPALKDGPVDQKDWKDYLSQRGMAFNRGASATYFKDYGHLVVVNTREQLALLLKLAGAASSPN